MLGETFIQYRQRVVVSACFPKRQRQKGGIGWPETPAGDYVAEIRFRFVEFPAGEPSLRQFPIFKFE